MKIRLNVIIAILLLSFTSCLKTSDSHQSKAKYIFNIDTLQNDDPIYLSQFFTSSKVIKLESNEDCLINRINNIQIHNDTIYIFDRSLKSIFIYSLDGKYISKISRVGRGPGEFNHPVDFDIDTIKDEIAIYDWTNRKLNFYNLNGRFLRRVQYKFRFLSFKLVDNKIYTFVPFAENIDDNKAFLLSVIDDDLKILSKYFKYTDYSHLPRMIEFICGGNFYASDYDLKFYMNYCNTIYSIKNDEIIPYISLNTDKYAITTSDIEDIKLHKKPIILSGKARLFRIADYSENNDYCIFKFNIGIKHYYVFLNKTTNEIICTSNIVDDLSHLNPILFRFSKNKYIGYIESHNNSNINTYAFSTEPKNPSEINNPLIIIYDIKKK